MGREVRHAALNSDIVDILPLRHVFVVKITNITHSLFGQDIYFSVRISDEQLLSFLVIVDAGDACTMQAGQTVVDRYFLALLVHAEQTAVRQGIDHILRHSNLCHIIISEMSYPILSCKGKSTQDSQCPYGYVPNHSHNFSISACNARAR